MVKFAEGGEADALGPEGGGEGAVGEPGLHLQQEVQARVLLVDMELSPQGVAPDHLQEPVAAGPAGPAGPVDMLLEMAPAQEPGQGILLEGGHRAAVEAQLLPEPPHEGLGQDQIADTDRRGQALGEGVHIDHPLRVHGIHGAQGAGIEAELAVEIVLDDPALGGLRPAQQLQPPLPGRHETRGEMMAGGDMEDPDALQGIGAHAPAVHADVDAADAAHPVDIADLAVARILHAVGQVPAQELDQDIIEEVGAGAHQDVLRVHGHAPEVRQMAGDGGPELRDARIGHGQQQLFAVVQDHLPLEPAPDREGEPLRLRGRLGGLDRRRRRSLGRLGPGHGLHEVAHLLLGAQVPLAEQLLIGGLHGDLADLQMLGQGPLAGELLPGSQFSRQDVRPDRPVKSLV